MLIKIMETLNTSSSRLLMAVVSCRRSMHHLTLIFRFLGIINENTIISIWWLLTSIQSIYVFAVVVKSTEIVVSLELLVTSDVDAKNRIGSLNEFSKINLNAIRRVGMHDDGVFNDC